MFSTTFCARACAGAPEDGEGAALADDVVLHVLDQERERFGSSREGGLGRGGLGAGRAAPAPARAFM